MDADRGGRLAYRMDRLGISGRELAALVGLDRTTIANARAGSVREATFVRVESALDDLEHETLLDLPDTPNAMVSSVRLPDGTIVTFTGSPEGVAQAAEEFLARRAASAEQAEPEHD